MVQCLSLSSHNKTVQSSNLLADWGLSVWSLLVSDVPAGFPLGVSVFSPQSTGMQLKSTLPTGAKLPIGMTVRMNSSSSFFDSPAACQLGLALVSPQF